MNTVPRYLYVAQDIGAANFMIPLVLATGGLVVALDKSRGAFEKHAIKCVETPTDIDEFFQRNKPSVLISGIGSPPDIWNGPGEVPYILEAQRMGIPVIVMEDFTYAHIRLLHWCDKLDHLCVIDRVAANLAREGGVAAYVHVVGTASIDATLKPSDKLLAWIAGVRKIHPYVSVFASGRTFQDLELAVECIKKTGGCLIPYMHPKIRDELMSDGRTYGAAWQSILDRIPSQVIGAPPGVSLPEMILVADALLTGFSTSQNHAAYHGIPTYALQTADVMTSLKAQTGLDEIPSVASEIAYRLTEAVDLATLPKLHTRGNVQPYDPDGVFRILNQYAVGM